MVIGLKFMKSAEVIISKQIDSHLFEKKDMLSTNDVLFLAYHNSFYEQNMFCNLFSFLTELGQLYVV